MSQDSENLRRALRVLYECGMEDLIKPGVLGQAGVGLMRPKRKAASGVAAEVLACSPPRTKAKNKSKSVTVAEEEGGSNLAVGRSELKPATPIMQETPIMQKTVV